MSRYVYRRPPNYTRQRLAMSVIVIVLPTAVPPAEEFFGDRSIGRGVFRGVGQGVA